MEPAIAYAEDGLYSVDYTNEASYDSLSSQSLYRIIQRLSQGRL